MDTRGELLKQFGEILVADMIPLAKRFAPTIAAENTDVSLEIKASPYISTLIDGRRPTSPLAKKGDPTLQEILLAWILERNITPREPTMTQTALSWAMANSMHTHGDKLYQMGGGRDIFAEVLNTNRINSLAGLLADRDQRIIAETTLKGLTL
jgi:hypothetical protein